MVGGGSCKSQGHGSTRDGRSPKSDAAGQTFPKQRLRIRVQERESRWKRVSHELSVEFGEPRLAGVIENENSVNHTGYI